MRIAVAASSLVLLLVVSGCAPSHRLGEVQLAERSVAVIAAIPPGERPVFGPWPPEPRMAPRPGVVRRRVESSEAARARLDRAAGQIDVAERVARHALVGSARALGFRPAATPEAADFVLDVRLFEVGFFAPSFDRAVQFAAEAEVRLVDRATQELVWNRRVRLREPVTYQHFGGDSAQRLSVADFNRLETEHLVTGLEVLADQVALRVVEQLAGAYTAARR